MKEEQIVPIEENKKPIKIIKQIINPATNKKNKEIIATLPSWSIEPPLEIKRGNK